eukprot:668597-Rhodomonas_salina.2
MRCPVLTERMVLSAYAMPGTGLGHGSICLRGRYAVCGTELWRMVLHCEIKCMKTHSWYKLS